MRQHAPARKLDFQVRFPSKDFRQLGGIRLVLPSRCEDAIHLLLNVRVLGVAETLNYAAVDDGADEPGVGAENQSQQDDEAPQPMIVSIMALTRRGT